jgi:carbon monoxide dehydrogenase subunit G
MRFDGRFVLKADAPRVWDFLLDPEQVSMCIPGAKDVKQLDERTFTGRMEARIGPIAGKFTFQASILDSDPPHQLVARLEGKESVTKGTIVSDTVVNLTSIEGGETKVSYEATVDVKGRLAIIGDMVLRATAIVLLQEITDRVKARVERGLTEQGAREHAGATVKEQA